MHLTQMVIKHLVVAQVVAVADGTAVAVVSITYMAVVVGVVYSQELVAQVVST